MITLPVVAVLGLLLTAGVLAAGIDWRWNVAAVAFQYALVAALAAALVAGPLPWVKLLTGCLVASILWLTGRRLNARAASSPPAGLPFRILATLMAATATALLASQPAAALPGLPPAHNLAVFLLGGLGLLKLGLTEEPINMGLGLVTVLSGFELAYAAVEPSLAVVALLAAVHLGLAMAASYLALLPVGTGPEASPG